MKRILIVEDDQLVARIYCNKLAVEGFQVETAADGEAGLEKVGSFRPEVVILDLMLPKMTGLQLIKRIRSEPASAQLPIVVLSSTYLTNLVQEAWKVGATKCLSKANCTPRQIVDVIRSLMPAAHAPVLTARMREEEAAAQATLRASLRAGFPAMLVEWRSLLHTLIKAEPGAGRLEALEVLNLRVHELTGNAAVAGWPLMASMADALEALLKELAAKPECLNASTLRTVALGIDFFAQLFGSSALPESLESLAPAILVVDDELFSRRAVVQALERAKLSAVALQDPVAACQLLGESKFDLVFLDIDMPGMNGYELCTRLRALPEHKQTPVVFVTGLNDFESRANSRISGGTDFIAKPFLYTELGVKALVYILRRHLEGAAREHKIMGAKS